MEGQPDPVTADIRHHRIAVFQGMTVYRLSHISHEAPGLHLFESFLNALLRHLNETPALRRDLFWR